VGAICNCGHMRHSFAAAKPWHPRRSAPVALGRGLEFFGFVEVGLFVGEGEGEEGAVGGGGEGGLSGEGYGAAEVEGVEAAEFEDGGFVFEAGYREDAGEGEWGYV